MTTVTTERAAQGVAPGTYTNAEFSVRAGLSQKTAYRLRQRGAIPGVVRVGAKILYVRAIVDEWIGAGMPGAGAALAADADLPK